MSDEGGGNGTSLEAKIVVLGSQGVGKTSLVQRYVRHAFTPATTASTVGASFLTKRVVDPSSGCVVRLQIWDTAGQERFRSISRLYYRGANAAVLCYDITDESSFAEMARWLTELRENLAKDTILHVVGTKADIVAADPGRRRVPYERGIAYVAENLHPWGRSGGATVGGQRDSIAGGPARAPTPNADRMLGSNSRGDGATDGSSPPVPPPPASNRSSGGLWAQDFAWTYTSCHEVSASTGEGVDEVFTVITRRLVEQRDQRLALELGLPPGGVSEANGDVERVPRPRGDTSSQVTGGANGGSFRVGYGDKRRSWLGLPAFGAPDEAPGGAGAVGGATGDDASREQREWQDAIEGHRVKRGGRCC